MLCLLDMCHSDCEAIHRSTRNPYDDWRIAAASVGLAFLSCSEEKISDTPRVNLTLYGFLVGLPLVGLTRNDKVKVDEGFAGLSGNDGVYVKGFRVVFRGMVSDKVIILVRPYRDSSEASPWSASHGMTNLITDILPLTRSGWRLR